MMKHLAALCVIAISATFAPARPSLREARKEWLEGNYAEAREMYEALAKDAKTRLPATLGLSQALESQGDHAQAQSVIETLLKDLPTHTALLARQAELHYL